MDLPAARQRPKFAHWRYERSLTLRRTADLLEQVAGRRVCSHETVRTLCLPFGHSERSLPDDDVAAAIASLTEGVVGDGDWAWPLREAAA